MSLSTENEEKVLDTIFDLASNPVWVGSHLFMATASPEDGIAGNEATDFARVTIAAAALARTDSTVSNTAAVTFTNGGGATVTLTHFGVADAASAGNCVVFAALSPSREVPAGSTITFSAGQLVWTAD